MGWVNYRIADDGTRICDKLAGPTNPDFRPRFRIVSEANVGNLYKIYMVSGTSSTADGFYLEKSTDGGDNYTTVDATGGTDTAKLWKMPASQFHNYPHDGWAGIDEGVDIRFAQDASQDIWADADDYGFTATLQDSNKKVFDGGWHYQIKSPRLSTSETIYTDALPIQWPNQEALTVVLNYNAVYPLRQGTDSAYTAGAGSSNTYGHNLDVQTSVDGTNWEQGSELVDDASIINASNSIPYGVTDPTKHGTSIDVGKKNFIRFFLKNTTANAFVLGTNYFSLAVYKM